MHLIHKWQEKNRKIEKIKCCSYTEIKTIIITYKCSICGKIKIKSKKFYKDIVKESRTESGNGLKTKEFMSWQRGDCNVEQARDRIKLVMNTAKKWINNNNINIVNIQEDYYCGGRWEEEKRGSLRV